MTYNILNGAPDRLEKIIEIVNSQNSDYLTIDEANTFAKDGNKILNFFAQQTKFPHCTIALSGKEDYHVAAFSKYPFKKITTLSSFARACIIAEVETELGSISVASTHLNPHSEDARLPEVDSIIKAQHSPKNVILMGDLNSLARADHYLDEIMQDFDAGRIRKFTTDGKLRFDVIDKLVSSNYFDVADKLHMNKESTAPTTITYEMGNEPMRLDYFLVSNSLISHVHKYQVIKNKLTNVASDHYPITMELQ